MNKQLSNGHRNATIRQKDNGDYEVFIGYHNSDRISGMDVVELKTYKRLNTAEKFCFKWIND